MRHSIHYMWLALTFALAVPFVLMISMPISFAQTCIQPPAGLVSWWPGDGNADDITGDNNGSLQNGAAFATGMVGQAFSFQQAGDFVAVPDAPSLDIGTGDFSIDAWIRTSVSDLQIIMDKRVGMEGAPSPIGYEFFVGLAGLGFQMADGATATNFDSGVSVQDGEFHHVAVTVRRGSTDGGKLFVDGRPVLTFDPTPYASNLDTAADFRIGARTADGPPTDTSFQGLIDEMEFFNRALTDDEVRAIFAAGSAGKCKSENFTYFTLNQALVRFARDGSPEAETACGGGNDITGECVTPAGRDSLALKGSFTLAAESDGIDLAADDFTLTAGGYILTIPAGSFTGDGVNWFRGSIGGAEVRARLVAADAETYRFDVIVGMADLSGTANPLAVRLAIGNDQGQTTQRLSGVLRGVGENSPVVAP